MLIKEHPILYSTSMIQAKLEGRKTQTRRIIKKDLSKHYTHNCGGRIEFFQGDWGCPKCGAFHATESLKCPYGKVGDILWSRETWNIFSFSRDGETWWPFKEIPKKDPRLNEDDDYASTYDLDYKATSTNLDDKWRPGIHQPKWASRIWERITDIRVERLQDISEADAIAEGIEEQEWTWGPT